MPTENRSSNTEIKPCPFCGGKAESRCTAGPDPDWFVQCTACRASADVFSEDNLTGWNNRAQPTEQYQGDPVAWLNTATGNVTTSSVVVMDWDDEKEHVQSLYTHADPGEAKRPSQIALSLQTKLKSVESERDKLLAQLAEQENSARELLRIIGMSVQGSAAYNRAVIAFHDSLNADTKQNLSKSTFVLLRKNTPIPSIEQPRYGGKDEVMPNFLTRLFRRKAKPQHPALSAPPSTSYTAGRSLAAGRPDPMLDPLSPLSPFSPLNPVNQVDSYEPPRPHSSCSSHSSGGHDSGSSYSSSDSCSSSSSSDSSSSSSSDY